MCIEVSWNMATLEESCAHQVKLDLHRKVIYLNNGKKNPFDHICALQ
jgi:hypothetical protein